MKRTILVSIILLFSAKFLCAQYSYNVNAVLYPGKCNQHRLTQNNITNQRGSVWYQTQIDLTNSFDYTFDVYLGTNDGGADGLVFVLQNSGLTAIGIGGGGIGYGTLPGNSLGIEIDTWLNGPSCPADNGDITQDHIAIMKNGSNVHCSANNLAGPVTIGTGGNVEDGQIHTFRVKWDATLKIIDVFLDGSPIVSKNEDMVNTIFGGNPMVWWGFTGSTGGATNEQWFRTPLKATIGATLNDKCEAPAVLSYTMAPSISFFPIAKFYWTFDDGSPVDSVNNTITHSFSAGWHTTKLKIRDIYGCEDSTTFSEFIHPKPTAWFNWNTVCENNVVTFTDSSWFAVPDNPPGTLPASFWWKMPDGSTSTGSTAAHTFPLPGSYTISHASTSLYGCNSDTVQRVINILPAPSADFTFNNNVCQGTAINFTDLSSGAITWNWDFGDGNTSTSQNPSHTYAGSGAFTVTLLLNQGNGTCTATISKTVTVKAKPIAYFKNNTICEASATTLTDSSYTTDGTAISSWWWDLGNGQFSTQQNPPVTYLTGGSKTIKLVVSVGGCISDTFFKTITVEPKPVAKFGISSPLCSNVPVQFSDSSTVATGSIAQWSWVNNGTVFSSNSNPSQTYSAGTQTVGLVATSAAGCKSDTAFKTFSVNPKPDISMNFGNACRYSPVTFTATDINGTGITSWNWTFGDGITGTGISTQHTYNTNGTYNVTLAAVSAAGCASDTKQGNIIIYSTNAFAGNDTIAAAGQPIQLNATGGVNYEWIPTIGLSNPFIANPVAIIYQTQQYVLKAFTPQGCTTYDTLLIKIYKGPDIYLPNAFTPNGDGLNDVLRGIPIGIKQFDYLRIYNRWGQLLFTTADYRIGWNGEWKGQKQEQATYIVTARGTDFKGNVINKKGTVMLIR